jgi:hypothetical protein
MIQNWIIGAFLFEFRPFSCRILGSVMVDCLQTDWTALFKRFYTFKAARCKPSTLKTVRGYLLPLINDMVEKGVGPKEFSDCHNTLRSEIMRANSVKSLRRRNTPLITPLRPCRSANLH